MKKKDVVVVLARALGLSESVSAEAVETIFGTISSALKKGESVHLEGFGSFQMSGPVDDLDESVYLARNPDVREAVSRNLLSSGRSHYLRFGQYENRLGTPPPRRQPHFRLETPTPPSQLRKRVHGSEDSFSFEAIGKTIAVELLETARAYMNLGPKSRVLDFGCGCGRVTSYFCELQTAVLYGTDIDEQAIAWCKENLTELARFAVNREWPPLPFEDSFFDLIFSVSVFTHLPETMQDAWLAELQRVSRPGALVLLSVHGENLAPGGKADFLYVSGNPTEGLPDFYQVAYHSERYIREHWEKFFQVEAILKRGIGDHQDLIVCRSR